MYLQKSWLLEIPYKLFRIAIAPLDADPYLQLHRVSYNAAVTNGKLMRVSFMRRNKLERTALHSPEISIEMRVGGISTMIL